MTVILVLATFSIFILLDWVINRRKVPQVAAATATRELRALNPSYVEGFLVPEELSYHPGHSWLVAERRNLVRIGMDDFAAALAGHVDRIEMPKPGQWLRQGQKAWTLVRDGEKAEMVSPTEGEVMEINPDVVANPELLRTDPYGKGWLALIHVPDEESTAPQPGSQGTGTDLDAGSGRAPLFVATATGGMPRGGRRRSANRGCAGGSAGRQLEARRRRILPYCLNSRRYRPEIEV